MIRVLIVNDHTLVRKGLRRILEEDQDIKIVGEADCSEHAIPLVAERAPDVMITDISHPGMNVFEAIPIIRSRSPGTRIVIVTAYDFESYIDRIQEVGISGFVEISLSIREPLLDAIHAASKGRFYLEPSTWQKVDVDDDGRLILKKRPPL